MSTAAAESVTSSILVVDDEELIRWSIRERLRKVGHEVSTAASGEEALSLVSRIEPDLVLLDVRLPGIDGLEVLRRLHEQLPELPVIILTAYGTVDMAVKAMKQGAMDFITKPFDLSALELTVSRALERERKKKEAEGLAVERDGARQFVQLVGFSSQMQELSELVQKVAQSDATTVLIQGESGSGKEVVARSIHFSSRRASKPFITINCTSLPEQLVESELLGYERGAFTDAKARKIGYFELADGGTLLLDEIGDMPLSAQAKLLRLLEEKKFTRVGGTAEQRVDVRVIAATHHDLHAAVLENRFRRDLYFRLNVMPIRVPPLREHLEDLPALAAHFISIFNHELRRAVKRVTPEAIELMRRHDWPGNVRELRNIIERAFIMEAREEIGVEHLPKELSSPSRSIGMSPPSPASEPQGAGEGTGSMDLNELEARTIRNALETTDGNQTRAAKLLGISRDSLRYRMKKIGLL